MLASYVRAQGHLHVDYARLNYVLSSYYNCMIEYRSVRQVDGEKHVNRFENNKPYRDAE